jgi:hypothetical protein
MNLNSSSSSTFDSNRPGPAERVFQDDTLWLRNVYLDLCNCIIVMTRREKLHNDDNNGDF